MPRYLHSFLITVFERGNIRKTKLHIQYLAGLIIRINKARRKEFVNFIHIRKFMIRNSGQVTSVKEVGRTRKIDYDK